MGLNMRIFLVLLAVFAYVWFRYAWNGFGGRVEDLEQHRKNNLMRIHFLFLMLVIASSLLIAFFA